MSVQCRDHYGDLLARMLAPAVAFQPSAEVAGVLQVERCTVYPLAIAGHLSAAAWTRIDPLVARWTDDITTPVRIVDRLGQTRPAYRGLLVYAWQRALTLGGSTLTPDARSQSTMALQLWAVHLASTVGAFHWDAGHVPARRGTALVEAAWCALALRAGDDPKMHVFADRFFAELTSRRTSDGTFLFPGPADNLESFWYDELVLLHAVASYAVASRNMRAAETMRHAAAYHVRETQPDHASNDPWALFAFIWHAPARSLADQVLHAVTMQHPAGATGVASLLLADALYCLRHGMPEESEEPTLP